VGIRLALFLFVSLLFLSCSCPRSYFPYNIAVRLRSGFMMPYDRLASSWHLPGFVVSLFHCWSTYSSFSHFFHFPSVLSIGHLRGFFPHLACFR